MRFSRSPGIQRFGSQVLFLLLALQFSAVLSAPSPEPIGTAKLVLGNVTATDPSGRTVTIKRGSPLYKGYSIVTGSRSFIRAEMLDGTRFTLGKNASASLTEFEFNESARTGKFAATVLRGGFEYESGKIGAFSRRRHSTIRTPSAVIGIRGSKLKGNVDASGRTLVLLESGLASITGPTGENRVTLNPGNSSEIGTDGIPDFFAEATPQQQQEIAESLPTPEEVQTATVAAAEEEEGDDEEGDDEEGDDGEGDDDSDADDSDDADVEATDADDTDAATDDTDADDTAAGETDAAAADADQDGDAPSVESAETFAGDADEPPPPADEPPPPAPPASVDSVFTTEPIASPSGEAPPI
ncbi:MAG: FecR domain-containing protein [Proteobacteria bacterium]|nr:FecR domain-containing protein [Pseudomonadota bacterium]